uniref:Putative HNH endonuclease n=1 Tax=viral metagenome TaxID=1070528 RepID=A0A6M3KBR1_9ZZZZ
MNKTRKVCKIPVLDVEKLVVVSALVDEDDYNRVSKYDWNLYRFSEHKKYVQATVSGRSVYLHRFVLPHTLPRTDHINQNTLDNRKSNLRPATYSQNGANRKLNKNNASGFRGVHFEKFTQRWRAQIQVEGVHIKLGRFSTPELAAREYNSAATEFFGEFAVLNKI